MVAFDSGMKEKAFPYWKSVWLFAFFSSLIGTAPLMGADYTWTGATTGLNWASNNWSGTPAIDPSTGPTGSDNYMGSIGSTSIVLNGDRSINMFLQPSSQTTTMLIVATNSTISSVFTADTISNDSGALLTFRNRSGGTSGTLTVDVRNLNINGAGNITIGSSAANASQQATNVVQSLSVTGTTSLNSSGKLLLNIGDAVYSLGLLDVNDGEVLLNHSQFNKPEATAVVKGLTGTGGFIRNATTNANNSSILLIQNAVDYSSASALQDGTGKLSVTKEGAGTQTLTAANTYTGLTTIAEGTLKVGDGGTTGSITSNVNLTSSSAAFAIDRSDSYTFSNTISGSGSFIKMGAGVTTLTGNNSYLGGTLIQGGYVQMANDANLGDISGAATLDGGGFSLTGTSSFSRDVVLESGGEFLVATNSTITWAGEISGVGALMKTGGATTNSILILSGNNSYSGGTVIQSGVLGVSSDENLGDLAGAVTFANIGTGRLNILQSGAVFNRDIIINEGSMGGISVAVGMEATWNGQISGAGTLEKRFAGQLTLSGSNSYSGGTSLGTGTLKATHQSALGTGAVTLNTGTTLIVDVDSGAGAVGNQIIFSGVATYQLSRQAGTGYDAYSALSLQSGGLSTTASILAGVASGNTMLTSSFEIASEAVNDALRKSDVFSLEGTGTDVFVLQLSVADMLEGDFVGWLDESSGSWVNAVFGNSATGGSAIAGYAGSYLASGAAATSAYLGSWGYDVGNDTVWAVLDHNSEFAVVAVPEPATMAMLVLGLGLALWGRRISKSLIKRSSTICCS